MVLRIVCLIFLGFIPVHFKASAQDQETQVLVYGSTPAGIAASVAAAREGMHVTLVEPSGHFGGMVTGGMSNPDFKTFESLGGFYREFMDSVLAHYAQTYDANSEQVDDCYHGVWYEPKVADKIFRGLIEKNGVKLLMQQVLIVANVEQTDTGPQLVSIDLRGTPGKIRNLRAGAFIDATYEGDLMAAAGVPYVVGRESRAEYGELFAGVKYFSRDHKFMPGSTGKGDHKIQCFNFRLCMTDSAENRIPVWQPENYRREDFAELLELIDQGLVNSIHDIIKFTPTPNNKADINDPLYSPFGIRLMDVQHEWPDGDSTTRARIFKQHKDFTLGLLYFVQNDQEVPDSMRFEAAQWGFPKDEFQSTNGFSPVIYVREGRRMKGDFVLTEHDTQPEVPGQTRAVLHKDAVVMCDYSMDSHGNGPAIPFHPGVTEGAFNFYVQPYQLPYRIMLPPKVNGLLVPVAVSASHVAYSSLRMEPTWSALGYAAGFAAAQALKEQQQLREININTLQQTLHHHKALTVYVSDVGPEHPNFEIIQYFGTQGYFHHLPENRGIPYIGRGSGKEFRGQYIGAYPYHQLKPEQMMDKELAGIWNEMAGLQIDYEGRTREQFLMEMYQLIDS